MGLMGGREGKCSVRVQNNPRSVNKATQGSTMKLSFYWHVFFIKYVITVILKDEGVNKAWLDVSSSTLKCYSIAVLLQAHSTTQPQV